MVRQRSTRAVGRLLAPLGIVVTAWVLAGCGGGESGVVAVEGRGEAQQTAEVQQEQTAFERIETVGTEGASSQSDRADAAAIVNDDSASAPSPEGASTGPLLQWSEFHPGIQRPGALLSTGDGRVVIGGQTSAAEPYFIVTADGSDWSELRLPPAIWPDSLDLTGERWAAAGWPRDDQRDAEIGGRIYVSDDEGSTWHEVRPEAEPRELPEYVVAHSRVAAVATSGPHVVAVIETHLSLDVEALLLDRGLLPPGTRPHRISIVGDGFGFEMGVDVIEEAAPDDAQGDHASQMPTEPLTFTVEELDLSAEQMAIIEGAHDSGSTRVYSGSGPELAETAVVDGWWAGGIGTDDGFALLVDSGRGGLTMFTSADGQDWDNQALDASFARGWLRGTAFEADGTVWMLRSDGIDGYVARMSSSGSEVQSARIGNFSGFDEFSAGPAGLATTAIPSERGVSDDSGLPVGRVVKDGYELRYGEPEGGITLWDVTADAAVYVFGPEIIESNELPEGVREVEEGDVFELTFEDPDTGEDLVTFTMEDLEAVFGDQMETRDSHRPEMWVGWSANGTDWGWQTVQEAFGIGNVDAQITVAVGGDFVVASVHVFEPLGTRSLREGNSADGGAVVASTVARDQRWFIARVP
ncbi:MAG: hypothetical protein OXF61_01630 [Acidimicrobiaceae bacterium]|nr:hypothetical protein [Acidimicrobiaceae bacterium]